MALAFFAVGVVSAWAIGMLSRGWAVAKSQDKDVADLCRHLEPSSGVPREW